MAKPAYTVLTFDLVTLRDRVSVLALGASYTGVSVETLPAGAGVSLAFGTNSQLIPVRVEGRAWDFVDNCGNPQGCDEGLFLSNPAGAGILTLLVSFVGFGGGSISVGT